VKDAKAIFRQPTTWIGLACLLSRNRLVTALGAGVIAYNYVETSRVK
jgi:hypothetical protein